MATVHAHRRTAPIEVELFGFTGKFTVNEAGHVVCEVPEGPALDRLLEITEAYTVYGGKPFTPQADPDDDDDTPLSKYALTRNESDETIDLRTLDRAGLLAFITEQELNYTPRANTPDDTVRDKIVALLTGG